MDLEAAIVNLSAHFHSSGKVAYKDAYAQRKTVTIQLDVTGNVKITYYFDDKYLKYANIHLFIELVKILKVLSNGLLCFVQL